MTNTINCHTGCVCCSQVQMNDMIERSVHNGATSLREPAVLQKPTHLANLDVQLINKPTDLVGQLDVLKSSTESFQTATEELSPLLSPGGFAAHSPFETLHPLAKLYLSFTNPSLVMLLLLVLLFFFVVNKRM